MLKKEVKTEVIGKYKRHASDTGSPEVQVAVLTKRIDQLVDHLKRNKKDHHSRRGLLILVGQRKRLLNYLHRTDVKKFEKLSSSLKTK
ncbi:MAG: 30S ribosomal protein S15 [Candidatus Margulisbacteria bacterium]|nr:30S ribosomal protein S15 [Candidatus Margulisiibacteriota bacterium]MBU1617473.1 30S ribosomal protein S15 [Candidatus Margulisiibacteriota bacterium]MBU1867737.1 30S ribosomal protein S15 [Candidatus Margulisiibacteriota bacterium]